MRVISTILVVAALAIMWATSGNDRKTLELATSGEAALYCFMSDGWRQIDSDKITDFSDGRWYFNNGSATRCKLTGVNSND